VVLRGGFAGRYDGLERDCAPMTVIVEPAGSFHANRFGSRPTHVLTLSLGPGSPPRIGAMAREPRITHDAYAASLARSANAELQRPDELTSLAVDGLALEIAARLARTAGGGEDEVAGWLRAARDLVHERYAEPLRLDVVAAEVGVEPDRLARAFHRAYRAPLAAYVRRLRIQAAAERLVRDPEASIATIAADVGFADQSHLTRRFVALMGTTPARYRAAHRSR
jgi:AraC family transcriptional regulator